MNSLDDEFKPSVDHIEVTSSEEQVDSYSDIDEKKLMRKIDLRLIPLFTILYLLSFLDRGNIGNAKIEGLAETLELKGNEYNLCLTIFFVFYASMEIPCNTILRYVKPKIFIPVTMMLWSVVMVCMGTVKNYHQLMATRALLGLFEASLFPGISYILSMYYKKTEVLIREAIFFSAASMAGAFSGLLAAAISKMDGIGGYEGWRWIFILEGLLTLVAAFGACFCFPLLPAECEFLTEREREFVVNRVKFSSNTKQKKGDIIEDVSTPVNLGETNENDKKWAFAVFKDWQSWCMLMTYYGVCVPLYGVSLFTPTIVKTLGYSSTRAQLMSVPIYIVAAAWSIGQAFASDMLGLRSPFLIFNFLCMAVGYIMCIAIDPREKPNVIYGACFIIALGIYPALPLVVVWFSNNLSGSYKRAVGMAFQIGIGNFAGAYASNFYKAKDLPRYTLGHSAELGFILVGLLFLLTTVVGYTICNRKRRRDLAAGKYDGYSVDDFLAMGDKSPHFAYRL